MTLMPRLALLTGFGLTAFGQPTFADETLASGAEIRQAISGNTLRGTLEGSGPFEEFYAEGGAIHGPDYSGEWSVQGNKLCLDYDGNPASCWGLRLKGADVTWVGPAGGDEGSAHITHGNPKNF